MVSTLNLDEKYNRVRKNFCFYLDIQDHGLARSLSRRIQDMGLQQEVFLTSRVSHVVRERVCSGGTERPPACGRREARRAGAMVETARRLRTPPPQPPPPTNHHYITLTVQKAISLLDKLYDTFFTASRKSHVRLFTKHFIKIEFLDKVCRPVFKEFDEWPTINVEPDPPKDKKKKTESPVDTTINNNNNLSRKNAVQKMTRKSRPRIKVKEEKEAKGGYCEMCNAEYVDAILHRRSPHHLAFVRDHNNFLALDSLIGAGDDVDTFLNKATPVNGERRSQRLHNGDLDPPPAKRPRRDAASPTRNGTRPARRSNAEDRSYYKVVGVSTKLRSSGGFAKKKESPPPYNGAKPLVVKFRKVRRSELSVLSDEAEQFMFPKRASSNGSTTTSEDEDGHEEEEEEEEEEKLPSPKRRSPQRPAPALSTERRRLARPLALKEESSEEDSWPEEKRRRKRRGAGGPGRRGRRTGPQARQSPPPPSEPPPVAVEPPLPLAPEAVVTATPTTTSPPPEDRQRCMKWEDGRLKYTPAVEQLEFAFESIPRSEPWFETFQRQDRDCVLTRNIPQYFSLYSTKAPKLPYEIGQLPPLKPNCCPLSDLVKREKPGPSRSYGTRGMKKQKMRKRTTALISLEGHPRKSPREHASTLAILGSAGLLNRRKLADDTKSTASEDTISETHSNPKLEPVPSEAQEASERLQQFLSEVFQDASDLDVSDDALEGEAAVTTSTVPDVSSLVSECDDCDLIRNELKEAANRPRGRRGKFKKKNKTGWPNKKKQVKKGSRTNSLESEVKTESLDRSSVEPVDDDSAHGANTGDSEEDTNVSETETENTVIEKSKSEKEMEERETSPPVDAGDADSSDNKLLIDLKVVLDENKRQASTSERGGRTARRGRRGITNSISSWLPVVRVARVDTLASRKLRSATRAHR